MFSPIPDMQTVRADVARSPFRSKVDVAAAFEQVRVVPRDVSKTRFATVTGTYTSHVMQFGDTNAPNTLNLVTNMMFHPCAEFLKIFFDVIHLHSPTRCAHLRHIRILLTTLRHYRFYLGRGRTEWFSLQLDSLGAVITDNGIAVNPSKWERIKNWPRPRNILDVQRFMGTINWMRDHLPQLSTILAPITRLTSKSVTWVWTNREEAAFAQVKALVPQVLRPIDSAKVLLGEHRIFLATDACTVGIGACLLSGPTYDTAVPFCFHSAKFNPAQSRYNTTNQELLAVVTACKEFEQHLLGYPFMVLSDNAGIQMFHTLFFL
ncbi:BQ5605_C054g12629 [Microbotryum silenes-dioicae]|uniref:BQ5605_C014g07432 protein n=1 Tax=Microbotryum silenes-dioicae TaxID=796604 RepID=A0A2X0LY60_9BASI|nr:BQ5605_C014g07432 [Microbotryum silenes-dioicae]SGZ29356.1 BQ5605_C054g12629 [Microbotryum silenes-dioicae]